MGRGSYSGGSTILNGFGQFVSHDEAAHDRTEISSGKLQPKPKPPNVKTPPRPPAWSAEVDAKREVGLDKGRNSPFLRTIAEKFSEIPNLNSVNDAEIVRTWNALRFLTATGKKWTPELVALARRSAVFKAARVTGVAANRKPIPTGRILKPIR